MDEEIRRQQREAEGEIIRRAKVVATTLARLRTNKALMDGPYDVVLVDEVGAANVPEVLLAVSRARRAAVLLGDFMQLGAIVDEQVREARRPDIQRWVTTDVFADCRITNLRQAQAHTGCTALDVQHRFGPEIMNLANAVAYGGLLKAGPNVRAHADGDPEIVLIDTDGLDYLGHVRSAGRGKGWWPAGVSSAGYWSTTTVPAVNAPASSRRTGCRSRHTGSIPRPRNRGKPGHRGRQAHRFQGREFPIVVFDLVEDEHDKRWMAHATMRSGR